MSDLEAVEEIQDTDIANWLLIEDEVEAQKLVVTWGRAYELWSRSGSENPDDEFDSLIELWGDISGVEQQRIRHFEVILRENGIIRPDGTTSARILNLLRARVARAIRTS